MFAFVCGWIYTYKKVRNDFALHEMAPHDTSLQIHAIVSMQPQIIEFRNVQRSTEVI